MILSGRIRVDNGKRPQSLRAAFHLPAVLLAAGFLAGSLAGRSLPARTPVLPVPAGLAALLSVKHPTPVGLAVCGFTSGYMRSGLARGDSALLRAEPVDGTFDARVLSSSPGMHGYQMVRVRVLGGGRIRPVTMSFEGLLAIGGDRHPEPGSRIRFRSRLRPLVGGGFTPRYRGNVAAGSWTLLAEGGGINGLRNRMAGRVVGLASGSDDASAAGVLAAISAGERSLLPWPMTRAMRRSGTAHLLAISGVHIGAVALFVLILCRPLAASLSSGTRVRSISLQTSILQLLAGWFYVVCAGSTVSGVRAILVAGLVVLSCWADRESTPVVLLSWCLLAFGTCSSAVEPGWALGLSLSACLGIVLTLGGRDNIVVRLFRISSAAYLFTVPLSVFLLRGIAVLGPLTNAFLALPFAFLLIPLAVAVDIAAVVHPQLASIVFSLWMVPAKPTLGLIRLVGDWRWAFVPLNLWGCAAAAAAAVFACFAWVRWSRSMQGAIALLLLPAAAGLIGHQVVERASFDRIDICFPGLGQADGTIIRQGKTVVLLDAGPPGSLAAGPPIERSLRNEGIGVIDALILTHPHPDHTGGAGSLIRSGRVRRVVLPVCPDARVLWSGILRDIPKDTTVSWISPGESFYLGTMVFEVRDKGPDARQRRARVNDISPILLLRWRKFKALFSGDAPWASVERAMAGIRDLNLLKIPHHGSGAGFPPAGLEDTLREATRGGLLLAVCPAVKDGSRHLPSPVVLDWLHRQGVRVGLTGFGRGISLRFPPGADGREGVPVDKEYLF
ncbi:MAG: ComEC/Rec2 family competence protein [bacterium]|nr:MAG: ComEC/Rec2 family competence protein [bacterium]